MSTKCGPNIITDGLVLCLDAGNLKSYPGSGSIWYNLVNSNNGTLVNGPTFSTLNNGNIILDGADDYIQLNNTIELTTWTIMVDLYYYYNNKTFEFLIGNRIGDSTGKILLSNSGNISFRNNIYFNFKKTSNSINNKKSNLCFVSNGTNISLYVDTIFDSVVTPTSTYIPIQTIGTAWGDNAWLSKFNIYSISVYNRILSDVEIQKNYNATKSRYII